MFLVRSADLGDVNWIIELTRYTSRDIYNPLEERYQMACFSPVTGLYSAWLSVLGSETVNIHLPKFRHDIIVRIRQIKRK